MDCLDQSINRRQGERSGGREGRRGWGWDLVQAMKYMSQSWLEPGINTRLAAQIPAGLSGSSPVPTYHASGHILEGILGSQAAAHLTHTELHCSSGSGGILGRAGESELERQICDS